MSKYHLSNRNSHLLGTKIRNLRKRHHLTMQDLSVRCIQVNPEAAPSVSYLSMIENGKRTPSKATLEVLSEVFQKEVSWFSDDAAEPEPPARVRKESGGISGIALEPGFLFSKEHLQIALPEMLFQTKTTGRQFAHLLIRAHQETNQNRFPDLERAAEQVGQKKFPISLEDIMEICKNVGLSITWFDRPPGDVVDDTGSRVKTLVRSFLEESGTIYVNSRMKAHPSRLKYDLSTHVASAVLHGLHDSANINAAGHGLVENDRDDTRNSVRLMSINSEEILRAWRNFECSFFAGALLCPKVPLRKFLDQTSYSCEEASKIGVSTSIMMRRMTSVARYPHWHYFDAYPPGKLKAIYRGNGIPLPFGSMRIVQDACQHWDVFRLLTGGPNRPSPRLAVMKTSSSHRLYANQSVRVNDMAGNNHVLCIGIDLNPALDNQGFESEELAETLVELCGRNGGEVPVPGSIRKSLISAAKILNIGWVADAVENPVVLTCQSGGACPRQPTCNGFNREPAASLNIEQVRRQIVSETN